MRNGLGFKTINYINTGRQRRDNGESNETKQ